MVLDFGGDGIAHVERRFEPVAFDGGWACHATLVDGACTDFNVFT